VTCLLCCDLFALLCLLCALCSLLCFLCSLLCLLCLLCALFDLIYTYEKLTRTPSLTLFPTFTLIRILSPVVPPPPPKKKKNRLYVNTDLWYVKRVWTDHPDGVYGVGERMTIHVQFSGEVVVETPPLPGGLPPTLTLLTGAGITTAVPFQGGSGTSTLDFAYEVAPGDAPHGATEVQKLRYDTDMALDPGTSAIFQKGGASAIDVLLVLPPPTAPGSLAFSSSIFIDTSTVTVVEVSSPQPDGLYSQGAQLILLVRFSAPVTIVGNPKLGLDTSGLSDAVADCFPERYIIFLFFLPCLPVYHTSFFLSYRYIFLSFFLTGIVFLFLSFLTGIYISFFLSFLPVYIIFLSLTDK
jgi:hypothetical protein